MEWNLYTTPIYICGLIQGIASAVWLWDRFRSKKQVNDATGPLSQGSWSSAEKTLITKLRPVLPIVITVSVICYTLSGLLYVRSLQNKRLVPIRNNRMISETVANFEATLEFKENRKKMWDATKE